MTLAIDRFLKKNETVIKYVILAIVTSILHIAVFCGANLVFKALIVCNIIAYTFSILFSFFANKRVVFKNEDGGFIKQLLKYLLVKALSFSIDTVILLLLTHWIVLPTMIAKLIANCSTTLNNYIFNKKFVFSQKEAETGAGNEKGI